MIDNESTQFKVFQTNTSKRQISQKILHTKVLKNPKELLFEKLQDGDKRFGQMIIAAKSRKERTKKQIILLEGHRLVSDAIISGAEARCIYFSQLDSLKRFPVHQTSAALYKVQYRHMKFWSDLETPPGIMGIFEMPKEGETVSELENPLPVTIICDNIRDPGNMGTLIRTATAAGCERILTTKGCVDVWDPKVLRAGMGSHFHIPIYNGLPWELLVNYLPGETQILIADTLHNIRKRDHQAVDADMLEPLEESHQSDEDVQSTDTDQDDSESEDNLFKSDSHDRGETVNSKQLNRYHRIPLPASVYHQTKYQNQNIALVIGGETHGISAEAKRLAFDRYGQYVTIPLSSAVNSLNSSISGSIILYEIHRQLMSLK
ncbi:rRNA methyltransferase 3, mitochondrial-like isoform X2 [Gigantopelta aegis]|uniref:rRNA methyltransferase 3, mitochondrial-like isoform X2 n=1 Tax=Gigantopelta aegis TaxID=1735272 RepID=UPI001B88C322|nr:rRNA methyltransferase 3, mitochondrial-like isoform X2 [Gigantopelta aegis]